MASHPDAQRRRSSRGYDRIARAYRPIERLVFGNQLQEARVALIDQIPAVNEALVLGDGDGRLLHSLVSSGRIGHITSVDQSDRMLSLQQQRLGPVAEVDWLACDARDYRPKHASLDLIVAAFFLDCFSKTDLEQALPQWFAGLRDGGMLYYVDFVIPESGPRRIRAQTLSLAMHAFFRLTTALPNWRLVDVEELLVREQFEIERAVYGNRGMVATKVYRKSNIAS